MADGKFYWLKLKRDFFKRHDIQIIEDMPNGKEYILFYLKLLCESVDHDGNLRFSEQIPYNENMLATITRTNVDIVRAAIQVFTGLNFIEILSDKTIVVHKPPRQARDRSTTEYNHWRLSVFRRDDYTCQKCGVRGVKINAHHIEPWSENESRRYDISNGITLCRKCHLSAHGGRWY